MRRICTSVEIGIYSVKIHNGQGNRDIQEAPWRDDFEIHFWARRSLAVMIEIIFWYEKGLKEYTRKVQWVLWAEMTSPCWAELVHLGQQNFLTQKTRLSLGKENSMFCFVLLGCGMWAIERRIVTGGYA